MFNHLLLMPLAAIFQGGGIPQEQQPEPTDRKVRIEIVTTENGETKRVTKELDNATEAEIEAALKDLGVMDHFNVTGDGENVTIDIRRYSSEGEGDDLSLSIVPMPPKAPGAPCKPSCSYAFLGVNTDDVTEELRKEKRLTPKEGAYITSIVEDTPAEKAGLKEGDVITAVDGKGIKDSDELTDAIREHEPGEKAEVTYYRGAKKDDVTVELAERKSTSYSYNFNHGDEDWDWDAYMGDAAWSSGEPRAFLGVTPGEGDGVEGNGAAIGTVEEGSSAEGMGIQEGDVITSVNGEAIADFGALSKAIKSRKPGDEVTIGLRREGKEETVKGALGETESWSWTGTPGAPIQGMKRFHIEGLSPEDHDQLMQEMDQLRQEMDELRRELGEDLGRELRREMRITIESRPLSEEEKALLKNKGVAGLDNALELGDMRCFPNQSNGFFRLHFDVPERGDLNVDVHDAAGEVVYQERITGFKGRYERTLDLSDKATGSYFLVISQNGRTSTQKLVKE